jgi:hypothetical protein
MHCPKVPPGTSHTFVGLLPNIRRAGVPSTLLTDGLHFDIPSEPTKAADGWFDQHCNLQNSEYLVHDPGAKRK